MHGILHSRLVAPDNRWRSSQWPMRGLESMECAAYFSLWVEDFWLMNGSWLPESKSYKSKAKMFWQHRSWCFIGSSVGLGPEGEAEHKIPLILVSFLRRKSPKPQNSSCVSGYQIHSIPCSVSVHCQQMYWQQVHNASPGLKESPNTSSKQEHCSMVKRQTNNATGTQNLAFLPRFSLIELGQLFSQAMLEAQQGNLVLDGFQMKPNGQWDKGEKERFHVWSANVAKYIVQSKGTRNFTKLFGPWTPTQPDHAMDIALSCDSVTWSHDGGAGPSRWRSVLVVWKNLCFHLNRDWEIFCSGSQPPLSQQQRIQGGLGARAPLPPRFLQNHAVVRQFWGGKFILSKCWAQGLSPWGQNSTGPPLTNILDLCLLNKGLDLKRFCSLLIWESGFVHGV